MRKTADTIVENIDDELYSSKNLLKSKKSRRVAIIILVIITLPLLNTYLIGLWYQHSQKDKPHELGVSFISDYARQLGVDPTETYKAILDDLKVRNLRLVSYWKNIEPEKGKYDFRELDWQMNEAAKRGARVSLAIGLRQPRWPECHPPKWIDTSKPWTQWQIDLDDYISAVVKRYRDHPALKSYQLENEFFIKVFGTCTDFSRERLASEYKLVKSLDKNHPVIVSRSNNAFGWPASSPTPDISGISIYRKVWDSDITHRYITYPFSSWYYSGLLGWAKLTTGLETPIHEMQAEPWTPNGLTIVQTPLKEQNKTFNAEQLKQNVKFAKNIGSRQIDFWGAEYWYYRKVILNDSSVWETAKTVF